eukprot:TRINITY_DN5867_c0_g1_i1.p1 TRINITY_DN5867_c0_g1~~TRINITY_DN5867_c0_g1_i1.p1  ORF type:complete len:359 (+),score=85.84 TRINITY_DN5867_c0_g1_i1:39-1079(+)
MAAAEMNGSAEDELRSDFCNPEVRKRIETALQLAHSAVGYDSKHDYGNATLSYRKCIDLLEFSKNDLPVGDTKTAQDLIKQYRQRLELIENLVYAPIVTRTASGSSSATKQFKFEPAIGAIPEAPPASVNFKAYWLMRVLAKTIQMGGYLTPKVYVPKSVWFQDGTKFQAINTKLESLSALMEPLLRLKDIPIDDSEAARELESFSALLGPIQNSLAKQLYFISEYKEDKDKKHATFGNAMKKMVGRFRGREKLDDASSYILLLLDVFENSQFLEKWLLYYLEQQPSSSTASRLKRVSEFFLNVVCSFVIKDLSSLIDRYMRTSKTSFYRKEENHNKKKDSGKKDK